MFWALALLMALGVGLILCLPLMRPGTASGGSSDRALYRAQLEEVERDRARGLLGEAEAERVRTEVARRLLAAVEEERAGTAPRPAALAGAAAVVLALAAGGAGLYLWLGAPGYPDMPRAMRMQMADEAREARLPQARAEEMAAAAMPPPPEAPQDYLDMIAQLREAVPTRPDDPRGWELLAEHEFALGNYAAAARAQERLVELRGEDVTMADREGLLDRWVAAAGGFVSPEAEGLARQMLEIDAQNAAGRYYLGLLHAQFDRPDLAFSLWRPLAEAGGAGPYAQLARLQVSDVAAEMGLDYTPPAATTRGPGAEDLAAAADMTAEEQQAMAEGMVSRLLQRLAEEGGPAEDWAQAIRALGVLGRGEAAAPIYAEAQQVFAGDEAALAALASAAEAAGLEPSDG
ncbi:c-type cytochrome biogenesis protein CcmI [Pseudoroseicyclus tamaricis]|uniref:C-type cytochrome biogenesis protein CcmI n=1 Tax=Pseudoroseicyclus tamaricis TaxID=2705421 RepID=A0A6B2JZ10_9RHOB|nr:c-type cytochrome biogenesis protein CcmI [Pseudoroseicyclus tamaricis]NDV01524.1 c-type cytochrome biogenesis protein CcmI [Pseudoroseicyclus tamaricis]